MIRKLKLTVVGCGDAFGSGGRLQTSYLVETAAGRWLIDCGATTLIGMQRLSINPDDIETIVISHLHGDHFSGLIWWALHGQHIIHRAICQRCNPPQPLHKRFGQGHRNCLGEHRPAIVFN